MRTYDTTFVLDGRITPEEREALIERFTEVLEKLGGKIERIVRWGMRPLAYEMKKQTRGYYVIFYHTSEPAIIKPFEHEMGLSEYVLRYMTILWDGVHPSYIHDEGQQAEAGELPPETTDIEESDDDVSMDTGDDEHADESSDGEVDDAGEDDPGDNAPEEEDSEKQDNTDDTESDTEESSEDDTDDSVKEAE